MAKGGAGRGQGKKPLLTFNQRLGIYARYYELYSQYAETVQPHPATSSIEHASTSSRNSIKKRPITRDFTTRHPLFIADDYMMRT